MCDLHEAAEALRADKRRAAFEARCIAYVGIAAALILALSLAGYVP